MTARDRFYRKKSHLHSLIPKVKSLQRKTLQNCADGISAVEAPNPIQLTDPASFRAKHLPTPTHPRKISSKKNCVIPHLLTTNSLHLILTASAQKIKAHTVRLRINEPIEP
jgi:hypothetical protein